MTRRLCVAISAAAVMTGCTAGGIAPSGGSSANVSSITTIRVSIAAFGAQTTPAGTGLGFSPDFATVAVGSGVQFVNVDNTSHTATAIAGATTFPAISPFTFAATQPSDAPISGAWSAGTLQPGATSPVFVINQPGEYLYGCFFHYSGGMRGVIVAK
jgi:plastocyanin